MSQKLIWRRMGGQHRCHSLQRASGYHCPQIGRKCCASGFIFWLGGKAEAGSRHFASWGGPQGCALEYQCRLLVQGPVTAQFNWHSTVVGL